MKEATRLELHETLCSLLGSRYVYFQGPGKAEMHYPCIVYEPNAMTTDHASNSPFVIHDHYRIIVIDPDPESAIPRKIAGLKGARAARPYVSDNLHHWPFDLWPVKTSA